MVAARGDMLFAELCWNRGREMNGFDLEFVFLGRIWKGLRPR